MVDMKGIILYDYQLDMLRRIEDAFVTHQSVMVQMPTGTGKTVLLSEVVKSEERRAKEVKSEERRVKNPDGEKSEKLKVKNPCVWIVVHRRELVEQIKSSLTASLNVECEMLNVNEVKPLDSSFFTLHSSLKPRVFSIQWLSRHYQEMEERPSLIIIDEAHHAVAKTYKEVMDAFPEAKKLGLTATPCRLNRRGFTDLFDVLLQSWSYNKFIADGWLSLYDYMSVREENEDWRLVNSLKKRGADGDFSLKEMSEKLNVLPSIERLCDTVMRYARNMKGIVYAIDIKHAEHIAQYYREHGLNAVAISSKTPKEERKRIIERFRNTSGGTICQEMDMKDSFKNTNCQELSTNYSTNCHELERGSNTNCHELSSNCHEFKIQNSCSGKRLYEPSATLNTQHCLRQPLNIQHSTFNILINVDLFGEGFDCPDVEFIQLARPTLSLAKYLQQVGRGMRVFEGKKYCLILDNVGLYRLFGLPSDDRDWKAMFEGRMAGKGVLSDDADGLYNVAYSIRNEKDSVSSDARTELITVMTHEGQRMDLDEAYGYRVIGNGDGMSGVVDKDGKVVMPYIYNKVELKAYGIAKLYSRRRIDRERPWMDLRNGVRFFKRPRIVKLGFMEFSTTDGLRLYPRVKTRLMDENCFVLRKAFDDGYDEGLIFRNFFVHPSEPTTLYRFKEKFEDVSIWEDEQGGLVWRKDWDNALHPMTAEDLAERRNAWEEDVRRFEEEKKLYIRFFKPVMKIDIIDGKTLLTDYKEPANTRITGGTNNNYQVFYRRSTLDKWESLGCYAKIFPQAYGIRVVQNNEGKYLVRTELYEPMEKPEQTYEFAELLDNAILHFTEHGKDYWVYLENMTCFTIKPELVTIGFMDFLKIGGLYMRCGCNNSEVFRRAEIRMYDDICFLGSREVFVKTAYRQHRYCIQQRSLDGRHFVLSDNMNPKKSSTWYDMYYDGKKAPIVERRKKDYEIYGVKK